MSINNLRNLFRTNRTPSAESSSSPAQRRETAPEARASQAAPASPYGIPTGRRHQAATTAEDGRRHRVQIGNPTPRSDAARLSGAAAGATVAGPGRMPNREVVEGALRILGGTDRSNITGMSNQDVLHVTNHVHQIGMLPPSRLDPRVVEAAQRGSGSAEQLVRNLLALVTSDSPVLPRRQRSETRPGDQLSASASANRPDRATSRPNHTNMPSPDVLTNADARTAMLHDAMDMLTGMHDIDLTAVAGRNTQNLIDHLQDIYSPPPDGLNAQVARAASRAHGDPEQLVLNLLRLVTRKEPVLSLRATSSAQPPTLPSAEVIGDAVVLVARGTGMPQATGQNRRDVAAHLRDIAVQPLSSLHAGVRQAAQRWHDNPQQLASSLLTLVTANPPVLSNNPTSNNSRGPRT